MTPSDRAIVKSLFFFDENKEDFVAPIPDGYSAHRVESGGVKLYFLAKIVIDKWGKLNSYMVFLYQKDSYNMTVAAIKRNPKKVQKKFNKWVMDNTQLMIICH